MGPPSSTGSPVVAAEGGPKFFKRKSSWHRRCQSKNFGRQPQTLERGGTGRRGVAPPPPLLLRVYGRSSTSLRRGGGGHMAVGQCSQWAPTALGQSPTTRGRSPGAAPVQWPHRPPKERPGPSRHKPPAGLATHTLPRTNGPTSGTCPGDRGRPATLHRGAPLCRGTPRPAAHPRTDGNQGPKWPTIAFRPTVQAAG